MHRRDEVGPCLDGAGGDVPERDLASPPEIEEARGALDAERAALLIVGSPGTELEFAL